MKKIKALEITDIINEMIDVANSKQYHCFNLAKGYTVTQDYFVMQEDGTSIDVDAEEVKQAIEYGAEVRSFFLIKDVNFDLHFLYQNESLFYENEYYYTTSGPIFVDKYDAELYVLTAKLFKLYILHHPNEDLDGLQNIMLRIVGRQEVA